MCGCTTLHIQCGCCCCCYVCVRAPVPMPGNTCVSAVSIIESASASASFLCAFALFLSASTHLSCAAKQFKWTRMMIRFCVHIKLLRHTLLKSYPAHNTHTHTQWNENGIKSAMSCMHTYTHTLTLALARVGDGGNGFWLSDNPTECDKEKSSGIHVNGIRSI